MYDDIKYDDNVCVLLLFHIHTHTFSLWVITNFFFFRLTHSLIISALCVCVCVKLGYLSMCMSPRPHEKRQRERERESMQRVRTIGSKLPLRCQGGKRGGRHGSRGWDWFYNALEERKVRFLRYRYRRRYSREF